MQNVIAQCCSGQPRPPELQDSTGYRLSAQPTEEREEVLYVCLDECLLNHLFSSYLNKNFARAFPFLQLGKKIHY